MGQGKIFDYKKFLKELEEARFRERDLIAERITAAYGGELTSSGEWAPPIDIYETGDAVILVAEVPGIREEDLRLEITGSVLTLQGRRPFSRDDIPAEYYVRLEFSYGTFKRSFPLPCAVDRDRVKASLKKGVLTVTVPRLDAGKGRAIKVNRE